MLVLGACSSDSSDESSEGEPSAAAVCPDVSPRSETLALGEQGFMTLPIIGGEWGDVDISGSFWQPESAVPDGAPADGFVTGFAFLQDVETNDIGEISSARVVMELDDALGTIEFSGPLGC